MQQDLWEQGTWKVTFSHFKFYRSLKEVFRGDIHGLKAGLRIRIHFIRIQHFRLNTNADPDPIRIRIQSGSRALMTKNWKKITAEKKVNFFWSKTAIYLSLGLHKVCPGYRRSLQLTKEAIQHFKTWIFSTFVGHFCPSGSGSGSVLDPYSIGSVDPDPYSESGSVFGIRIRIRIQEGKNDPQK